MSMKNAFTSGTTAALSYGPSAWCRTSRSAGRPRNSCVKRKTNFMMLVEFAPVGILISDRDQKTVHVNRKCVELFGYTIEDMPSVEEWWPLAYPDKQYREAVRARWNDAAMVAIKSSSAIEPQEYTVTCKDGTLRQTEIQLASIGELNVVTFTDVLERTRYQDELRRSRDRLARAELISGAGNWEFNLDDKRVFASEGAREIYGLGDAKWQHPRGAEGPPSGIPPCARRGPHRTDPGRKSV